MSEKNDPHYLWAKEMKEKFPNILNDYTLEEVRIIWEAHSEDLRAGWLTADEIDDKAEVEEVFGKYYFKDDNKTCFLKKGV